MRKYILSMMFSFGLLMTGFSQADVVNAFNAMTAGEYEKAATYIDEAVLNPKANIKEKTWRYRGQIYMNIALDPAIKAKYPKAAQLSAESFIKANEIDPGGSYQKENDIYLQNIRNISINSGVEDFQTKDYASAKEKFATAQMVWAKFGMIDTLAIYNGALASELSGDSNAAIEGYKACAKMNYNVPAVYMSIFQLQRDAGNEEAAIATLKEARSAFPRDQGLVLEETNIYLASQRYAEAEENLKVAIELDPTNEVLHFALGSVYDNLAKYEDAKASYLKAIDLKADYFDALYNLGALFYNQAVEQVNACGSIPPNQETKYKACVAEANKGFTSSVPYLERAYSVNPDDVATVESLKNAYIRSGQDDKYLELKAKTE